MKSKALGGLLIAALVATTAVSPAAARDRYQVGHGGITSSQDDHRGSHHGNHRPSHNGHHNGHHHGNYGNNGHHDGGHHRYYRDNDDGDLVKGLVAGAIITGIIVNSNNN
jgi:hypothetical protein